MAADKVVYPATDVTLCGFLNDVNTVLYAVSDAFSYKEHARLDAAFLLIAQTLIAGAAKEAELHGQITLEASEAQAFLHKEAGPLDASMVLAALLSTAAKKAVMLQQSVSIGAQSEAVAIKSIEHAANTLRLSAYISPDKIHQVINDIDSAIYLSAEIGSLRKDIVLNEASAVLRLMSSLDLALDKQMHMGTITARIGGSIEAVERRYRTLGDLDGLTLRDLSSWTMRKFYYIEGGFDGGQDT